MNSEDKSSTPLFNTVSAVVCLAILLLFLLSYVVIPRALTVTYAEDATTTPAVPASGPPPLNTLAYDMKLLELSHVATTSNWYTAFLAGTTTLSLPGTTTKIKIAKEPWPVRAPYPKDSRALLPFNRIVSYYGNFYSKQMGVLGQYDEEEMLRRFASTTELWRKADPTTPVVPAIHYIAMVAQAAPGKDGKYRAVMPDDQVDHALALAQKIDGIVFLDLQVGLSDVQTEVPKFKDYLALPQVHLGLDPEFAMKTSGVKPGRVIGTLDANDINFAIAYLTDIVKEHNLPPKVLMIHRFTQGMVTNYAKIKPTPEVQVVMDMDGWGDPAKKISTYTWIVADEPVQFTGFKLFYKNDLLPPSSGMMTPEEVLKLKPAPSYIQYQ